MRAPNAFVFLVLFLFCFVCASEIPSSPPAEPHWLSDWEEGRKAAWASGKPLFVVFRCQH